MTPLTRWAVVLVLFARPSVQLRAHFRRPQILTTMSTSIPEEPSGRRRFLEDGASFFAFGTVAAGGGAALLPVPAALAADEDDAEDQKKIVAMANIKLEEGTVATVYEEEGCAFTATSGWERLADGGGFKDKFTQEKVAEAVAVTSSPTALTTVADLGAVETVDVVKVLNLEKSLGIKRADLVAAAKRGTGMTIIGKGSSGSGSGETDPLVFYTWDLAASPPMGSCKAGDEFGGALGCSYDRIILLSAAVQNGKLFVLSVLASAEEWKGRGKALRALRDSHQVLMAAAPAAPAAPAAAEAGS